MPPPWSWWSTSYTTLKSGHSAVGGAPSIPVKAAQWRMKRKCLNFPAIKLPRSSALWGQYSMRSRELR